MENNNLYLISRTDDRVSALLGIDIFFTIHGWMVFSIPRPHYNVFKNYSIKFYEIDKSLALGFRNFADARKEIKVISDSEVPNEEDGLYVSPTGTGKKVKIPVTASRYNSILNAMKLFSKILLEDEYNKRYKKLLSDSNELEVMSWKNQLEEIEKYNNGQETPLLSKLSEVTGNDIPTIISTIQTAKQRHDNSVNELFIELQGHKTKFKSCTTIEELNWLYFEYFNMKGVFSSDYINENPSRFTDKGEIAESAGIGYKF